MPKQWEVSKSCWKDVSLTLCCFCLIFHCEALEIEIKEREMQIVNANNIHHPLRYDLLHLWGVKHLALWNSPFTKRRVERWTNGYGRLQQMSVKRKGKADRSWHSNPWEMKTTWESIYRSFLEPSVIVLIQDCALNPQLSGLYSRSDIIHLESEHGALEWCVGALSMNLLYLVTAVTFLQSILRTHIQGDKSVQCFFCDKMTELKSLSARFTSVI